MMEIQIKPIDVKPIDWNYEEIKKELDAELEPYRNPTSLDKKSAKDTVAFLNKLIKAMNDKAIAIDKELSKPIKDFRAEEKELNAMVEEVQKPYKNYLNTLTIEWEKERDAFIFSAYQNILGKYTEVIPLEDIDKDGWWNTTCTEKAIVNEMETIVINLKEGLAAIERMNLPYEIPAIDTFFRTISIKDAIETSKIMERIAEFIKKEDDGIPYSKKAEISATDSQFEMLENFCKGNGIDIEWR